MSVVVISGANRGIGLGLCALYQAQGDTVVALCRKSSEALDALGVRVVQGVDATDADVAKKLSSDLSDISNIDILVNVAGMMHAETLAAMDYDKIKQQFDVNAVGPIRVSLALLDKLQQGAKIAMITSRMGSITDNTSGARYGYRMSKAALNAGSKSLAMDLKDREIAVAILHPGFVSTDMTNHSAKGISVEESCTGLAARIHNLTMDNTATFWHSNGEVLPW